MDLALMTIGNTFKRGFTRIAGAWVKNECLRSMTFYVYSPWGQQTVDVIRKCVEACMYKQTCNSQLRRADKVVHHCTTDKCL